MLTLVTAVLVASIVGSLHCAGMCGAFVAFAVGSGSQQSVSRRNLHFAYHGGRLVTYSLLGAVAGVVGAAVDLGGDYAGVSRLAAMVAGITMTLFGIISLLKVRGVRIPRAPVPKFMTKTLERGHRVAMKRGPLARALIIGLMTTLLPCGWLYAFAVVAAGTGHAGQGALVMAVFWIGTVPVLVAVGEGVRSLAGAFGRFVPEIASVAIIAVGLMSTAGRLTIPSMDSTVNASEMAPIDLVGNIDSKDLPCCDTARE